MYHMHAVCRGQKKVLGLLELPYRVVNHHVDAEKHSTISLSFQRSSLNEPRWARLASRPRVRGKVQSLYLALTLPESELISSCLSGGRATDSALSQSGGQRLTYGG